MIVGIIGLGSIARKHILALRQQFSNVVFYALRHNKEAATEQGVHNVYSYEELLAKGLDFIIISNPTSAHYDTIAQLKDIGIPLFIEKPLFDKLKNKLPEVQSHTYVACNLRFLDCIKYIKESLAGQRINEVNAYCGSYLPDWRQGADWRRCYSANREMGGGVHIDLIHEIDYLYWLFGEPSAVRKTFRNVSSLDITSFDYANYAMEYDDFAISVILNYYRRDYKRTLEILTDNDTWEVDLAKNTVFRNGSRVFASQQTLVDTYSDQMIFFVRAKDECNKFNDIGEAYKVLKICLEE